MNQAPQVSVVMSVYNGSQYLKKSVESILNQEDVHFEFIIVDDGSNDDSGEILESYAEQDTRIRLFHRQNEGLTKSLIFACNKAASKVIARHDADDVSLPGRLFLQYELMERQPQLALVSSWARYIGPDGEDLGLITRPEDSAIATRRLMFEREGPPAHGSVAFRKEFYEKVGGYRDVFYYGQDADLWLRMCAHGEIGYVPFCLYEYRFSRNSISIEKRDIQKRFGDLGQRCHAARLAGKPEDEWLERADILRQQLISGSICRKADKKRQASGCYFLGSGLYAKNNPSAKRYFIEALRNDPWHWRAWIKLVQSSVMRNRS